MGATPLSSDEWRNAPSRRKDTRLWCKGKVGRAHIYALRIGKHTPPGAKCHEQPRERELLPDWLARDGWVCYHERYCRVCGRIDWANRDWVCPERIA